MLDDLARELHVPVDFLQNVETLLQEKKQLIFQGPPGTGKTYVAQRLTRHRLRLAGSGPSVNILTCTMFRIMA